MYQFTQHKFWGALALIISIMFVAFMVTGCGGGDDDDDDDTGTTGTTGDGAAAEDLPPSATSVMVDPAAGGTVPSNQQFTLTFDQGVEAATVNGTPATGSGANWTASPALAEGSATLNVGWTNRDGSSGSQAVGPYTVSDPDTTPPEVASSPVTDGANDVDPATINAGIRIDFNEAVTGTVDITDEAGASLKWTASVSGQTATLTPVAGTEAANETTYKIEIDVNDGAGNNLKSTITFVTKPKE